MEQIYAKIENYLRGIYPGRTLRLNKYLKESVKTDVWGFNSVLIITSETGEIVEYKPVFKK